MKMYYSMDRTITEEIYEQMKYPIEFVSLLEI